MRVVEVVGNSRLVVGLWWCRWLFQLREIVVREGVMRSRGGKVHRLGQRFLDRLRLLWWWWWWWLA